MRWRWRAAGRVEAMGFSRGKRLIVFCGFEGFGEIRRYAVQVKFVSGEGDHDSVGDETPLDFGAESVTDAPGETGIGYERVEAELKRRVAKAFEYGRRRRIQENVGILARDGEEQIDDAIGVGSVGDAELDRHAQDLILERPVDEIAGDEFAVGDDHALVVTVDDRGGADVDAIDLSGRAGDGDDVADSDGPFQKQDDAADEIGDDFLKAEAEADAQGGENDTDLGEVDVHGRKCEPGS